MTDSSISKTTEQMYWMYKYLYSNHLRHKEDALWNQDQGKFGSGLQSQDTIAMCLSASDIAMNHQWRLISSSLHRMS
jgi:hypothetical protein